MNTNAFTATGGSRRYHQPLCRICVGIFCAGLTAGVFDAPAGETRPVGPGEGNPHVLWVLVDRFGADPSGTRDSRPAVQAAVEHAEATKTAVRFSEGGTYAIGDTIFIRAPVRIVAAGAVILWDGEGAREPRAMHGKSIFRYVQRGYPEEPGLDGVVIEGGTYIGRSEHSDGHHVFASDVEPGGPLGSGWVCGRVDNFLIRDVRTENLSLCMSYGSNFRAINNIVRSSRVRPSDIARARHVGIGFNHFTGPRTAEYDDRRESDCIMAHNTVTGFGVGLLAHAYYNIDDPARRFIRTVNIHDNHVYGLDNSAGIRGHAPIYVASAQTADVHDNRVDYAADVGIDLEFVGKGLVHGNFLRNASLAHLWNGDVYQACNNVVWYDDAEWLHEIRQAAVLKTAGSMTQGAYVLKDNLFYVEPGLGKSLAVAIAGGTHHCVVDGNQFFNTRLRVFGNNYRAYTRITDNDFSLAMALDETLCEVWPGGDLILRGNEFRSLDTTTHAAAGEGAGYLIAPQATKQGCVRIEMVRFGRPGVHIHARQALLEQNRIYGWTNSIEIGRRRGGDHAHWTVAIVGNQYDGKLTAGTNMSATVQNNRVLIRDNWFSRHAGDAGALAPGVYTAHPATAAEAAAIGWRYRPGSRIEVLPPPDAAGATTRWILTDPDGLTWRAVSDW
jgi:hypothetical protein